MGVSGSGKTTIGRALADVLGWGYADADDFHPPANVAKMRNGTPLTDADRLPWLDAMRGFIGARLQEGISAVLACSALKARYRERLLVDPRRVTFVYLQGTREVLHERLSARRGHFMPAALLDSQLADLEEPEQPAAIVVNITEPHARLVARVRAALER